MSTFNESYDQHMWACPRKSCDYTVRAATEHSLEIWRELHISKHRLEDARFESEARKTSLASVLRPVDMKTPEQYEVLELTLADKAFLMTRGIKVD